MGRAAWLQLLQAPLLEAYARSSQIQRTLPLGQRRSIVDRNGRLLALDEERFRLWAHPIIFRFPGDSQGEIRSLKEVAQKLSTPLGKSVNELMQTLETKSSGVRLAEDITPEIATEINGLQISGLDLEAYPQRVYPQADLFANVIGFLNDDRVPQAGLEQSLNKKFLRQEKAYTLKRGGVIREPDVFNNDNHELHLTLDTRLQKVALNELRSQVLKWNARKGVAIVMDSSNGEILALASTPSYDPNKFWEYSPSLFREWSVQDLFEPGSVFKPINLALALEEGAISPKGTVYDSGVVNVGGWALKNWNHKANGVMDYAKVLQVSSNVGMVNIMKNLSSIKYWEWLNRLELDKKTETDLPGAIGGELKAKEIFLDQSIHHAVASFGQGFSITPLKLAQLHAVIANGGKLVTPHVTKGFSSKKNTEAHNSVDNSQVLSQEVTRIVLDWMESVVDEGSGKGVKTEPYRIAGKTGTADQWENGKLSSKICSFVAILPVEAPRFVVVVAVDDPKKEYAYGSTVAVPVAKKIIESLLVLEKIPPSLDKNSLASLKD
tara:strand:- start:10519 stop:12168 length:1650 start_codon:yes stop_codon:yes gene_type:complete